MKLVMKNYYYYFFVWGGGGGRLEPLASIHNILFDLHNSSHPTQPHSIIAKY